MLIFSTAYLPFVGGAEVAIKEITNKISDVGFDMITARLRPDLPKFENIGNVSVYRMGFGIPIIDKLLLPFWGAFYALRLNAKNDYMNYWCMMVSWASGAAYIANILGRKTPIILTLQEGDSEKYLKTKWLGLIDLSWRLALKRSIVVTAISSYLAERTKRLGYKKEVKIIPNGVNIEKFELRSMSYELREKIRKELELEEKDIALITTSRLNMKNGVEDVIKALPKLSENIKFIILGTGELEKKLKKLARNLKVSKRVTFLGLVSFDDIPKYLKACDIFIRPSLSEGMGNSFIEAMAAGIPVIGTPVGGIIDFLKDSPDNLEQVATGYFCEPKNPESIVKVVKKIINDPNKDKIVENAKKMVTEKYNWDLIAKQMENVIMLAHTK